MLLLVMVVEGIVCWILVHFLNQRITQLVQNSNLHRVHHFSPESTEYRIHWIRDAFRCEWRSLNIERAREKTFSSFKVKERIAPKGVYRHFGAAASTAHRIWRRRRRENPIETLLDPESNSEHTFAPDQNQRKLVNSNLFTRSPRTVIERISGTNNCLSQKQPGRKFCQTTE